MRSVEHQNEELWKDIKREREMEVVAAEMDIAFTTDFWTSSIDEIFMTMSIHWTTWDWHLKTRILGVLNLLEDNTAANISEKLMDLRLEFGVYLRTSDGRTTQFLDVVRLDKLLYFTLERQLDKPVLAKDYGSDVSLEA